MCMQNIITQQQRRATQFLEKYVPLSLFAKACVCERELETEQNCNILTSPTPPDIAVRRSRSPRLLLNRRAGGPASLGHVPIPASSHQLVYKTQSGVPRAPSAGWWLYLKGLCVRGSWRPNRTAIYWPPTLMAISVVSFSFSRAAQPEDPGPSSLLDDGFLFHILSLTHLISNSIGGPEGPFGWVVAFPTTTCPQLVWSPTHWLPVSTELYNSSIAFSISLEWHVCSSSTGNNCHAVHRSLSSGASVYECSVGF